MDTSLSIYVLKLQSDKYYVGKTQNKEARLLQHFTNNGSAWTKKYPPIEVIRIISDCDDLDEDKYTLQYMKLYGIDNVRGGSFVQIILDQATVNVIQRMIHGSENKCFVCGEDHFVKDCEWNIVDACTKCGRVGHTIDKCYAKTNVAYKPNAQFKPLSVIISNIMKKLF